MSRTLGLAAREKKGYIEKTAGGIAIGEQAGFLGIARSSVYYHPVVTDACTLEVMNEIDKIYTKRPYFGVRRITDHLQKRGYVVNHKRVHHLMQIMGIMAVYPKPNLSKNTKQHPIYPYLLKGVVAGHANHIWGTDITYIRMRQGFVYLTAYLDWYSRFIVSWRLSTTLETAFCYQAAEEAIQRHGIPEIINEDQGVQNTDKIMLSLWEENNVKISMDHKGRCFDNIFNERLWRTIKYEEVYLKSYETVPDADNNIGEYIKFYNTERPHQSLGNKTPKEVYENSKNQRKNN